MLRNETQERHEHQLREELAFFQQQMKRFLEGGDCAYERALCTAYQALVEQRTRQLAALRAAGL